MAITCCWRRPTELRDGATRLVARIVHLRPIPGISTSEGDVELVEIGYWCRSDEAWCHPRTGIRLDPQPYAVAEMPYAPAPSEVK